MVAEMAANIDRELDVTGEVCPMPFVKAKLTLESMPPGQLLRIVVDYRPAFDSMPLSLALEGHEVLWAGPVGGVGRIGTGPDIRADAGARTDAGPEAELGVDAGPGAETGSVLETETDLPTETDLRTETGVEPDPPIETDLPIEPDPRTETDSDTGPWEIFVRCRREETARV